MTTLYSHTFVTPTVDVPWSANNLVITTSYPSATFQITGVSAKGKAVTASGPKLYSFAATVKNWSETETAVATPVTPTLASDEEILVNWSFGTNTIHSDSLGRILISVSGSQSVSPYAYGRWYRDGASSAFNYLTIDATITSATKPINPSPANSSEPGVDFSDWTLGWEEEGTTTSFKIYFGDSPSSLNLMVETSSLSYIIPELSGFRNYLYYRPAYWRVDAINGSSTVTGDVWSFDPRPAAVTTPVPANTATAISTCPVLSWAASATATSYNVYAGLPGNLISQTQGLAAVTYTVGDDVFDYITEYNWRIDATNYFGTTTGTVWSFTSLRFDPPMYVSYYSVTNTYWSPLIQANGTFGAGPDNGGTENTTFVYVAAPNNILTRKRLIVLANSKLWYET